MLERQRDDGTMNIRAMGWVALLAMAGSSWGQVQPALRDGKVAVTFEGGHETDPRDRGRPVVLVAGALGVKPETFREAFSRVHPARDGGPTPEQARANKAALMAVLAPLGISNERLDEVSNHYRYRRERGEMWPTRPAKAFAVVKDGRVVRFEVTDGGEGYSSSPRIVVPGFPGLPATATLRFDKRFERNGSVMMILVIQK